MYTRWELLFTGLQRVTCNSTGSEAALPRGISSPPNLGGIRKPPFRDVGAKTGGNAQKSTFLVAVCMFRRATLQIERIWGRNYVS